MQPTDATFLQRSGRTHLPRVGQRSQQGRQRGLQRKHAVGLVRVPLGDKVWLGADVAVCTQVGLHSTSGSHNSVQDFDVVLGVYVVLVLAILVFLAPPLHPREAQAVASRSR